MQKTERFSQPSRRHSPEGTVAHRRFAGGKHSKKDASPGGKSANDFLNTVFRPLPATWFHPVFGRENYDFLYRSAMNYARLLGSSFDLRRQENDFTSLLWYFEKLLPEGQHLYLMEENKKLRFKILFGNDFLLGEVFFIPIEILNRTEGDFRDIVLTFFQLFRQMHALMRKEHQYDYEMIVEGYLDSWYDREENPEVQTLLEAYRNGYINDTFSAVYQEPNLSTGELEQWVKSYKPKNEAEKRLITSIRQGINILYMDKNIFDYACHPGKDDENFYYSDDDCIIEAGRLIRFVYSGSDYVTDSFLESINAESECCANEYFPRNSLVLTPDTGCLIEVDFVECFFSWLMEFINSLYEYENG